MASLCMLSSLAPPTLNRYSRQISAIPQPRQTLNFESLKDRLIKDSNAGRIQEAISTLDLISCSNLTPDLTTYSVLLKSCIRTRNFELGQLVHSKLSESGLDLDTILLNSLISLYAKCGDWRRAEEIFSSMGKMKDLVSWSAMISCYSRNGLNLKAIMMFMEMVEFGEWPNEYCFSGVLHACSNGEYADNGLEIFGFLVKTGYFDSDVCVGCALIDLFVKGFGDVKSAKKVFDEMPENNPVSWTLMITRLTHMGCGEDAIALFLDMISTGFDPDKFTYSCVLSACSELGWLSFGKQLHSLVVKNGLSLDTCVGCSLVDMYAKCVAVDDARRTFDQMPDHNVMSWTAIITACVRNGGCEKEAFELYYKMISDGRVKPNHFTFAGLLKGCGNLFNPKLGDQIYNHAVKLGFASLSAVGNSLISMYAKTDRLDDARRAFECLFEKNLVSYNSLVDGYSRNSDADEAFELYNEIEKSGANADAFTFASLLSGAASIGAIGKGEQIHALTLKTGFASSQCVSNALIAMYTRCGSIEAGLLAFNKMEHQNVISWTSIITGFAKHGFAKQALDLFNKMLDSRTKPNEVTFVAVLSACSHVGLIDEGWSYFHSMRKEHGIIPRVEHYACMVDILGRSGLLDEALDFIKSMPFTPDALIWRTMLSACSTHGNVELGEYAAERIIEQDPSDSSAHVLLSNLYASSAQWEKVTRIRKEMKQRNLVKEAGISWIEVASKVHRFYVGDTKHPKAKEIYKELEQLVLDIKKIGYVPDTNFVLHEVDENQKEQYLFQHSEKIALAYGLISTSKPKTIRIFKNLRVCGDCHTAIKYASLATGREIVVRDSNRFHHFKDGICSCKDYW